MFIKIENLLANASFCFLFLSMIFFWLQAIFFVSPLPSSFPLVSVSSPAASKINVVTLNPVSKPLNSLYFYSGGVRGKKEKKPDFFKLAISEIEPNNFRNFFLDFSQKISIENFALGNMIFAQVSLISLLILRWIESGHFPLSNLYESLMFLSWSFTFLYLFLDNKVFGKYYEMPNVPFLGSIISPCALFINAFASFSLPEEMQKSSALVPALQSNWLMMHVTVMILSYTALILGSLLSVAFLILINGSKAFSFFFSNSKLVLVDLLRAASHISSLRKKAQTVSTLQSQQSKIHDALDLLEKQPLIVNHRTGGKRFKTEVFTPENKKEPLKQLNLFGTSEKSMAEPQLTFETRGHSGWKPRLHTFFPPTWYLLFPLQFRGKPAFSSLQSLVAPLVLPSGITLVASLPLPYPYPVGKGKAKECEHSKKNERTNKTRMPVSPALSDKNGKTEVSNLDKETVKKNNNNFNSMDWNHVKPIKSQPKKFFRSTGKLRRRDLENQFLKNYSPREKFTANAIRQNTLLQSLSKRSLEKRSSFFLKSSPNNLLQLAKRLDQLSYRILGIGFPLLTIGILSGAVWANEAWGSYWSWDPKETWALLTWLVFAIYLHTRLNNGWKGEKPAMIASLGFLIVWICYLGVNLLGEGLHSYGWFKL